MPKSREKTIPTLPYDMLLQIFSDNSLGIRENSIISLVCKDWCIAASNNQVWRAMFLKDFSWSPALFYPNSSVKESYKQQLFLNISFKKNVRRIINV